MNLICFCWLFQYCFAGWDLMQVESSWKKIFMVTVLHVSFLLPTSSLFTASKNFFWHWFLFNLMFPLYHEVNYVLLYNLNVLFLQEPKRCEYSAWAWIIFFHFLMALGCKRLYPLFDMFRAQILLSVVINQEEFTRQLLFLFVLFHGAALVHSLKVEVCALGCISACISSTILLCKLEN